MTAKVHLLPSGHDFSVEPGETLLDAALRSGLSIRYSCNSGSCGECRARLVSGELGDLQHHDYVLCQRDRDDGQFLLCRAGARSDLVLEAVEAKGAADVPVQRITTQVCKLVRLSEDVMEVHLRTPRSKTLWFLAGQHVRLTIPGQTPRNKSIASCPCNGMVLQFHVRRVPGDTFSEHVFSCLKVRDSVDVEGPFGSFVLDEESDRPILYLAFETGFAPIKSLIEHAISLEMTQPMHLYWIARDAQDHYLANYCRSWHDALDDFAFTAIAADERADGLDFISAEELEELSPAELAMLRGGARILEDYPDLGAFDVYANGPDTLLSPIRALLLAHGLQCDRLFIDHIQRY